MYGDNIINYRCLECGWCQYTDGGTPQIDSEGYQCCPVCGARVVMEYGTE